jgi:ATP-dependent RNA helicase DOB1
MDLFSGFDTAPLRVKRPLQDGSEQDPNKKHKPEATTQVSFVDYQEQEFETIDVQGCVHEVCYPPFFSKDEKAQTSANESPAKTYPFELDIFQKQSISCLERLESVLVSAHTSAGKTVVAEYAIAMALRDRQRVIYTSPIKALSNQKFRELQKEFKDVGLMTGDVVINPGASCLVMTTEILRNMLYRGSEVVREVAWIIYDEIHYMSDKVRGVVWEESIILLPHSVRFVFLSATIPNAREFCFWIAKLHRHPCNVVYTDRRPVPLQHYVMPRGGKGLHLVVDKDGTFKTENFQRALDEVKEDAPSAANKPMRRTREANQDKCSDISKLARMLKAKDMCPVIFFAFSMRDCEDRARELAKIDFIDDTMKEAVTEVFSSAISNLKEEDRELPQVLEILPILQRGIGIHHAGLLPILKEVVEILFQEGLLRVMFSTETFSMGINFPARTVVFTNLSKFDGVEKRIVTPGEYIQMSGRAGRRGLDTQGIVILMMENKIEPHIAKETMKGKADTLNSSFYVGFNMLLNLLRLEDADPEYVIVRSFAQFQSTRTAPEALARIEELRHAKEDLEKQVQNLAIVKDYVRIQKEIDLATQKIRVIRNRHIHPYLNPGRLFRVIHQGEDFGWGILVRSITVDSTDSATNKKKKDSVILDILLSCDKSLRTRKPAPLGSLSSAMRVLPTTLEAVAEISALRMKIDDNKALSQSDLNQHGMLFERFPSLTEFQESI